MTSDFRTPAQRILGSGVGRTAFGALIAGAIGVLLVLVFSALPWVCSQPEEARRILEEEGYSNIEIHGWSLFACGKDDSTSDLFTATSSAGVEVHGVVCGSWFTKGFTVRRF